MIYERNGEAVTTLRWNAPTQRTDGTAYGSGQHAGYELGVSDPANPNDGFQPWVSVPAGYDVTEWPLDQVNITDPGQYEVALRTVDAGGLTSDWSAPLVYAARLAAPSAPTGLSVF